MEKKTPLYEKHIALNGKLVPFAGYLLPVQYTGVIGEHMAVRQAAGLFDVSHMGEVLISGPEALDNLNLLYTNDFTNMRDGRVRYTLLCNEDGGIVDDMLIYRLSEERYMAVPNAANRHKVVSFLKAHAKGKVIIEDVSDKYAQIALQGPKSTEILAALTDESNLPEKYYTFKDQVDLNGIKCLVSQTGYTGEQGYELYCDLPDAGPLWDMLMEAGKAYGLTPCGLGARDTLRLEAGMPLYGHEMDDTISPLETGLDFAVKINKVDFMGKQAIINRGEPAVVRVGLKITGRGIAREQSCVYVKDRKIGRVTSGTFLPYLEGAYAMALIDKADSMVGTAVEIDVRGRRIAGEIVPLPFYVRQKNAGVERERRI